MLHEVKFIKKKEIDLQYSAGALLKGGLFAFQIRGTKEIYPVRISEPGGFLVTPAMIDPPKAFHTKELRKALMGDARSYDFRPCTDGKLHWHLFPLVDGGMSDRERAFALFRQTFRVFECDFEINYAPQRELRKCDPGKPPVRKLRDR